MKQQQPFCDTSIGTSADNVEPEQNTPKDTEESSKKRFGLFFFCLYADSIAKMSGFQQLVVSHFCHLVKSLH